MLQQPPNESRATESETMAYTYQPQSSYPGVRIGLITADWHHSLTHRMRDDATEQLKQLGVEQVEGCHVPGAFELGVAAETLARTGHYDALIAFGCVIKGETRHDTFIAQALFQELQAISTRHQTPVICGVLTTETLEQAQARVQGSHSRKGRECALAALQMVDLMRALRPHQNQ